MALHERPAIRGVRFFVAGTSGCRCRVWKIRSPPAPVAG